MAQKIDFVSLLHKSQEYISENYAAALSDRSKVVQLRSYIEKYLHDSGFEVEGMTFRELSDKLYSEMAEYSVLTKYLGRDEIEEININGWDDIAVTYTDGHIEKAKEHFYNPQHAVDVVKRLLHHSGMIIDNATPMSQGHLPGNTRITALKEPLVDDDRGISVSIRLLHPSRVDMKALVKGGNATQKMIDFLCMCLRYGISFVVALLDTRTPMEYSMGHVKGFINIPVDELRERIGELDRSKPVYVICQSGLRSYIASRILMGNGFDAYNFAGGFRFYDAVRNDKALNKKSTLCGMDD